MANQGRKPCPTCTGPCPRPCGLWPALPGVCWWGRERARKPLKVSGPTRPALGSQIANKCALRRAHDWCARENMRARQSLKRNPFGKHCLSPDGPRKQAQRRAVTTCWHCTTFRGHGSQTQPVAPKCGWAGQKPRLKEKAEVPTRPALGEPNGNTKCAAPCARQVRTRKHAAPPRLKT